MKIGEQVSSTAVGMGRTQAFQIKQSSKAFEILSSGIYSDKILAPLRELSANAVDAHIAVNQADRPFEVVLPTQLAPLLRVRDFGPGLTEEEVMSLYTTYFESTKSDSNDYIGCLGLGSKSPFAYTDSFTVESFQDGVVKIYAAHLVDGLPSISKVGETATEEENGLAVSFSVQKEDIQKFQEKAFNLFGWFKVKPVLNIKTPYKDWNVGVLETDGMFLRHWEYGEPAIFVLMGQIAYPVNGHQLDSSKGWHWDNEFRGLVLRAEIGDVEIATSRESLGFTEKTKKWINHKLSIAPKVFAKELINVELAKCGSWWEAFLKSEEYRKFPLLQKVDFEYQGEPLPASRFQVDTKKAKVLYLDKAKKIKGRDGWIYSHCFEPDKLTFYRNDVKQGFVKRMQVAGASEDLLLITALDGATEQEVCDLLHIKPGQLKDISSLTYATTPRAKKGTVVKDDFYHISKVSPDTLDTTKTVYVMPVRRHHVVINDLSAISTRWSTSALVKIVEVSRSMGWITNDDQVTGVLSARYNSAKKAGHKGFFEEILPKIEDYIDKNPRKIAKGQQSQLEQQVEEFFHVLGNTPVSPQATALWALKEYYKPMAATALDKKVGEIHNHLKAYYNPSTHSIAPAVNDPKLQQLWSDFLKKDSIGRAWNNSWGAVRHQLIELLRERTFLQTRIQQLILGQLSSQQPVIIETSPSLQPVLPGLQLSA